MRWDISEMSVRVDYLDRMRFRSSLEVDAIMKASEERKWKCDRVTPRDITKQCKHNMAEKGKAAVWLALPLETPKRISRLSMSSANRSPKSIHQVFHTSKLRKEFYK